VPGAWLDPSRPSSQRHGLVRETVFRRANAASVIVKAHTLTKPQSRDSQPETVGILYIPRRSARGVSFQAIGIKREFVFGRDACVRTPLGDQQVVLRPREPSTHGA